MKLWFIVLFQIILIQLKIENYISLSWWIVLLPFLILSGIVIFAFIVTNLILFLKRTKSI